MSAKQLKKKGSQNFSELKECYEMSSITMPWMDTESISKSRDIFDFRNLLNSNETSQRISSDFYQEASEYVNIINEILLLAPGYIEEMERWGLFGWDNAGAQFSWTRILNNAQGLLINIVDSEKVRHRDGDSEDYIDEQRRIIEEGSELLSSYEEAKIQYQQFKEAIEELPSSKTEELPSLDLCNYPVLNPLACLMNVEEYTPCTPYIVVERKNRLEDVNLNSFSEMKEDILLLFRANNLPFNPSWFFVVKEGESVVVGLHWQQVWGPLPIVERPSPRSIRDLLETTLFLLKLHNCLGWGLLDSSTRERLNALLGGEVNIVSSKARRSARDFMYPSDWEALSPEIQAEKLTALLTSSSARPEVLDAPMKWLDVPIDSSKEVSYDISEPTFVDMHLFRGIQAKADRWSVSFPDNGQMVTIYTPRVFLDYRKPIWQEEHDFIEVKDSFQMVEKEAQALALLPISGRRLIVMVTLNPIFNPDDSSWAEKYNDSTFASVASVGSEGDVTIYPNSFGGLGGTVGARADTLMHEIGHIWSDQTFGSDFKDPRWNIWRAAMESDRISLSQYATAGNENGRIQEDAAETVNAYLGNKHEELVFNEYRALVPARFAILDQHFA